MQKKIVKYFRLLLAFRCMKENNEVTIEEARVKHFRLQLVFKYVKGSKIETTMLVSMENVLI